MATDKTVVLLDHWASPFGQRVHIALAEKGVEFEVKDEDLWNKSELLLKYNPVHKKIPVLIHGGKTICECLNIVEYIDEVWNDRAPLLPAHSYERAQARFWADYVDKKAFGLGAKLWMLKSEAQEAAKVELIETLKTIEGALGYKKYFCGDTFSIVDITLVPLLARLHTYKTFANMSIEEVPKLVAWGKRCMKRDGVSKHLPDPQKLYEYTRNKYGVLE